MTFSRLSVQRSFRISARTSELLDSLAETSNESRNSLVERLLGEALRLERHPMVRFRTGASGRREPYLCGTRLLVRQVVAQLRDARGDVDEVADYLGVERSLVRAARDYYADFGAEIDVDAEWAASVEASEHARWERQQAALA
jgi:uncharacterized protein (DUF433 family)